MSSSESADKTKRPSLTIPVIEERAVLLSKPRHEATTRVRKVVRAEEASVETLLRAEDVDVERIVLDPPVAVESAPAVRQEGDTTVIPILEERLVIEKRLFVREELRVRRSEQLRLARERVTLLKEDVEVDREQTTKRSVHDDKSSFKKPQEREMERVLIGVFDSRDQAESARRQLCDCGIAEERITMRAQTRDDPGSTASAPAAEEGDVGFFARLFGRIEGHESSSPLYPEAVNRGDCVVVVDGVPDDRIDEAVAVLQRNGAIDIDERASKWRAQGSTGQQTDTSTRPSAQMQAESRAQTQQTGGQASIRIPVVEEQLQVGKREVQRGGVRVYTRTTERPVQQDVTLREEHARVERRPVDRPATEAELGQAFEEKSIELRETVEEPVIAKTAHVVEEVQIGKEVSERTERVQDTVRRTEVEVEDMQGGASSGKAERQPLASDTGGVRLDGVSVDDLNGLLRDELSAIETYRQALDKNRAEYGQDSRFQQLVEMLNHHEQAASQLRQLIRQAGGNESNDSGAWGTWANTVMGTARLFGDKAALKALKEGEESGIKDYRSMLDESGLPAAARNLFTSIVEQEKQHVAVLDRLIDAV